METGKIGGDFDVIIVGAGVIGLATAREIQRAGGRVAILDRADPGQATSRVAAGMLAPVAEVAYGEERLLQMTLASARAYPDYVKELERDSGESVGHMQCGALHIALDRDEAAELRRKHDFQRRLGLEVELLGPSACRELEPGLATGFHGGVRVLQESVLDPRLLVKALLAALRLSRGTSAKAGNGDRADSAGAVTLITTEVAELQVDTAGRATGVKLGDGRVLGAAKVVAATGSWSGAAAGWLPPEARPPVRPVKGQILELAPREMGRDALELSGIVATERVYLVPRADGRLVIGATVEEMGFDTAVTAGGIHELLREAYRALPDLAEMELLEATAGLRPATPDNLPVIGPSPAVENLIFATGHYRNGILLAPLTATAVAELVSGGSMDSVVAAADPARFVTEAVTA